MVGACSKACELKDKDDKGGGVNLQSGPDMAGGHLAHSNPGDCAVARSEGGHNQGKCSIPLQSTLTSTCLQLDYNQYVITY